MTRRLQCSVRRAEPPDIWHPRSLKKCMCHLLSVVANTNSKVVDTGNL